MSAESGVSETISLNIYDERLDDENTVDLSSQGLEEVPKFGTRYIVVLYLQNNKIELLPDDLFPNLVCLMYLDLRDNLLRELPETIKTHPALTHLLLQNNCLTSLPNELGTVNLKVLQIGGNPLTYPPQNIISAGKSKILTFLHDKYIDHVFNQSLDINSLEPTKPESPEEPNFYDTHKIANVENDLKIEFNEKVCNSENDDDEEEFYSKIKGKCLRLDKCRQRPLPVYFQSAKYLKPLLAEDGVLREDRIKRNYYKDMAITKRKELLATRDKIIQGRKNLELLKKWRNNYRYSKFYTDSSYRLNRKDYPYDTNPEYMTLLTREDIEKDLPDKYKKKLVRRCRPSEPRKANNDVHLAMKIKKLFENLEAIDLNKEAMTPRTEQKVLLNEIHKISEIKQKLMELSTSNFNNFSEV